MMDYLRVHALTSSFPIVATNFIIFALPTIAFAVLIESSTSEPPVSGEDLANLFKLHEDKFQTVENSGKSSETKGLLL